MLLFRESIRGFSISFCIISTYSSIISLEPPFDTKIIFSHETTKEIPPKTCIKEKYFLFLQQIKRKNDGKGKYKLISSPS